MLDSRLPTAPDAVAPARFDEPDAGSWLVCYYECGCGRHWHSEQAQAGIAFCRVCGSARVPEAVDDVSALVG